MTPLVRSRSAPAGIELYWRNEALNPSGSHTDRALAVAATKAVEFGYPAVMLYSDGRTALSSAGARVLAADVQREGRFLCGRQAARRMR
jgi:threonine synthase